MSRYKMLIKAAQQLDDAATLLEKTALAKTAADQTQLASLAKFAADKLMSAGLISSAQKRDAFAAEVMRHDVALQKIAKLADLVSVPSIGKVSKTAGTQPETGSAADEVWAKHVSSALARLSPRAAG